MRVRVALWGCGLVMFVILAGLQWHQIRQTRFIEPANTLSVTNAFAVWKGGAEQYVDAVPRLTFCEPFLMMGPLNSGIPSTGTAILHDLPYAPAGYTLNICVANADNRAPPLLTVSLNNVLLRTIHVPYSRPGENLHGADVPIPGSLLQSGATNRLAIRAVKGLHWKGHLALIPHAQWRKLLPLLVPLSGWCVLAFALFLVAPSSHGRWFPVLMCSVLFTLYLQSFYVRNMAPAGGFLFSDSADFIDPICRKLFTSDMNKHLLFMPVVRFLMKPFQFLSQSQASSLAAALAFIGALNGVVAFLWFRRWLGDFRSAGALALTYSYSLAIWAYSSVYETYPFSSLLANLFFLVLFVVKPPERFRQLVLPSLMIGVAALAHVPLFILFVPLVIRTAFRSFRAFPWGGAAAAALLIVFVFLAGQTLIRNYYADRTVLPPDVEELFQADSNPLSKEISNIQWIYGEYAQKQHPTSAQLGAVLTGQFVYSLAGLPYPFDWSRGMEGLRDYFHSVTGALVFWGLLLLWIGAIIAMVRSRDLFWRSLALILGVVLPWLTFFLYFNPMEMLLYSSPMAAPVLAWLAYANRVIWGRHTVWLLLAFSLVLALHNAWVLASYC